MTEKVVPSLERSCGHVYTGIFDLIFINTNTNCTIITLSICSVDPLVASSEGDGGALRRSQSCHAFEGFNDVDIILATKARKIEDWTILLERANPTNTNPDGTTLGPPQIIDPLGH